MRNRKQPPWLLILNRADPIQRQPAAQDCNASLGQEHCSIWALLLVLHDSKQLTQLHSWNSYSFPSGKVLLHPIFSLPQLPMSFPNTGTRDKIKLKPVRDLHILKTGAVHLPIKKSSCCWSIKIDNKNALSERKNRHRTEAVDVFPSTSSYEADQFTVPYVRYCHVPGYNCDFQIICKYLTIPVCKKYFY